MRAGLCFDASFYSPGGTWADVLGPVTVSCGTIPIAQCTSRAGCSLTGCDTSCENGSTLLKDCVGSSLQRETCPYGCGGTAGSAYCKARISQQVSCDPACNWSYRGSYGGGGMYIESFDATNTCNNLTKNVYYQVGVCGPGVTPCQTLDHVDCSY